MLSVDGLRMTPPLKDNISTDAGSVHWPYLLASGYPPKNLDRSALAYGGSLVSFKQPVASGAVLGSACMSPCSYHKHDPGMITGQLRDS
jgi:hypothetical protein